MQEHFFKINIGDWSSDGHQKTDVFIVKSSKPNEEVQDAFLEAGKKLGLISKDNRFLIADGYEDSCLSQEHYEVLKNAGIHLDDLLEEDDDQLCPEQMAILVMRIAQTKLAFEFELISDEYPNFNGFWDKKLNISLGYGLYD